MPRFYFDTDNGERQFRDEDGIELASMSDVPGEALDLLRDMTHASMPVGLHVMTAKVRDITDAVVYRVEMTVVGKRYD